MSPNLDSLVNDDNFTCYHCLAHDHERCLGVPCHCDCLPPTAPELDSAEYWRQAAQRLAIELYDLKQELRLRRDFAGENRVAKIRRIEPMMTSQEIRDVDMYCYPCQEGDHKECVGTPCRCYCPHGYDVSGRLDCTKLDKSILDLKVQTASERIAYEYGHPQVTLDDRGPTLEEIAARIIREEFR